MKQLIAAATLLLAVPAVGQEIHAHQHIDNKEQNEKPMRSVGEVPPDPHAGHTIPTTDDSVPQGVAPPIPTDHAAEAFYPAATMARARAAMIRESGGMTFSQLMLDRLEYRAHKGANGYAW